MNRKQHWVVNVRSFNINISKKLDEIYVACKTAKILWGLHQGREDLRRQSQGIRAILTISWKCMVSMCCSFRLFWRLQGIKRAQSSWRATMWLSKLTQKIIKHHLEEWYAHTHFWLSNVFSTNLTKVMKLSDLLPFKMHGCIKSHNGSQRDQKNKPPQRESRLPPKDLSW